MKSLVILSFPVLLFLPGYLIVNHFTNHHTSQTGLTTIEAVFLSVVLSSALAGIVALALAQVGYFGLPALVLILLLVSFGMAVLTRLEHQPLVWRVAPSPKTECLVVAAIAITATGLFLHPHQYILGGGDAGVYVNLGVNLSKTGALLIREPLLTDIEPDLLPGLLREQPPGTTSKFIRLPGFYLSNLGPGLVIPQFYPLHPVWLGIGYSLFGVTGALLATPVWGVLSVVVIYLYGRSLFNRQTGGLTAFLLLIIPLQIYFARYPTAEPLTQYLSWTGLWAFTAFDRGRSPRGLWGLAAGVALGQSFLARIDTLPLLLLPAGWILSLLWRRRWQVSAWWFVLPLASLIGYAVYHGLVFSRPYTLDLYGWTVPFLLGEWWPVLVIVGLGGGILGLGLRYRHRWNWPKVLSWKSILRYVIAILLVGAAVYAYFVRPRIGDTVLASYWYGDSQIPISNHENLVRLGWYLSPLGIGLAVVGGVLLVLKERWGDMWPLWGMGGSFTVLYIYNIFNNPFQIYAMRRYVPIVVPFFALLAAYTLERLWKQSLWKKVGRLTCIVLLVMLVVWLIHNDWLIWRQVDYDGAVAQVAQAANLFEKESIALFVDQAPVGLGAVLGTPLHFLYDITSFDLQEGTLDISLLQVQISHWLDAGYTVYVVRRPGASTILPVECLIPTGTARLDVPRLEQSYDHAPSAIQRVRYEAEIYQVAPGCLSKDG